MHIRLDSFFEEDEEKGGLKAYLLNCLFFVGVLVGLL